MRNCRKWFLLPGAALLLAGHARAEPLTPAYEPRDNAYYVCYEQRRVDYTIHTVGTRLVYHKFKHLGCIISRQSCCHLEKKKPHCPPVKYKPFGYFNNYPQALNAFYRCAYND